MQEKRWPPNNLRNIILIQLKLNNFVQNSEIHNHLSIWLKIHLQY